MSDEERIDPPDSTGLVFESPEWWRVQHDYLVKLFNRSEKMQREAWAEAKTAWAERDSLRRALEAAYEVVVPDNATTWMAREVTVKNILRKALQPEPSQEGE